jgi:xylan 1,4-beta-xylosidase
VTSTYPNPLIPGFNPDPSCVLVDGTYYLVTSSFEYVPGLPVYRSTDFVTWEHIGNVATREAQIGVATSPSGGGVWAPTIRYRDGIYYVIVCIMGSARGCVVFTASDPAGQWSDGTTIEGVEGIDPDLAWDDGGTAYVTYSGWRITTTGATHRGILQARVDLSAGKVLEEPRLMWSGTGLVAPEAPHLYRRGDYWYLVIAEGGTESGHSVSVARSTSIEGPFEGAPANPVLSASGTGRSVQCTGHADLVQGPNGDDVMVLLGTRRAGATSPLGRETYVTSLEWVDGWPKVGPVELAPRSEPVDEVFTFTDDTALADPGWLAVRQSPRDVGCCTESPGHLTIRAGSSSLAAPRPAFIGRRQRHLRSTFACRVDVREGSGGLALRYDEVFYVALDARAGAVAGRVVLPTISQEWTTEVSGTDVTLQIETHDPEPAAVPWCVGGDRLRLVVKDSTGVETVVAEVDGRFWSVEAAQPFTGRVTGMYAEEGVVRFSEFRYHGEGAT